MNRGPRRVTLGRVAGVYGVKGWVKVQSYTRPEDNILNYPRWYLAARGAGFEAGLIEARAHGRGFVAWLRGPDGLPIKDREAAAALVGAEIQVERAALPDPAPGTWYWCDLIGLQVESDRGATLGTVTAVTSNGAQEVLVVEAACAADARVGGTEDRIRRLIPFVPGAIIEKVELERGRIVARWAPDW
ncbi:MAG: 16S rRNA processing protein RimM [Nevskia sp.]|nr:16S rRNA processing protein RimM [Nevskia sp.]